jgi:hypothetical protein
MNIKWQMLNFSSLKIHDALLTNSNSLLGSTFFAKINGIAVCGTVKLQYEEMEKVIYGAVFADKIQAWVKLVRLEFCRVCVFLYNVVSSVGKGSFRRSI